MRVGGIRYLSVCSGIEAATVAWHPLGWEAAAYSEIEAFPRAVLSHHYPDTPLHGDFTTIGADDYGSIDLLVGGTPCQSFSVAGLRGGLADDRGNLALEYLRLAQRKRPEWLVWENVPGVLSSNGGRDFGSILGGLVELGYGYAYRVLDAQFFGVPQRRRRVFVVGYLGDWRRAAAVLFERHSLQGNPAPRREKGQRVAGCLSPGAHPGGFNGQDAYTGQLIGGFDYENNAHGADEPTGPLLKGSPTGGGRPLPAIAYALQGGGRTSQNSQGSGFKEDVSFTLNCMDEYAIAFGWQNSPSQGLSDSADTVPTLDKSKTPAVAFAQNQLGEVRTGGVTNTLNTNGNASGRDTGMAAIGSAVRRLIPRECERLQGFPDDYTLVPYRGKPAADGPRYKALGNSMAVPVMRWIGDRICQAASLQQAEAA